MRKRIATKQKETGDTMKQYKEAKVTVLRLNFSDTICTSDFEPITPEVTVPPEPPEDSDDL